MKRSINILSLLFLLCAGLLFLYLYSTSATASANVAFSSFPLNQPQLIKFDLSNEALENKSKRERLDQLRDWLLYAVVSDSGQSARELGEILYDLPATRDGYMHHVGNFEYSDTRSRLVHEGEVVALVPADNASERIDQLAHIADEHRKNTGEKPKSILVFEYKLNGDDQNSSSGEITRRDTINGADLFTAKYGYYESTINSLDDLKRFMQQTDDIVFGRQISDSLVLGGRKITSRTYRNISVEDVAAIWQSEHSGSYQGSGFSLDPTYKFAELKKFFDKSLAPLDVLGSDYDPFSNDRLSDLLNRYRPRVLKNKAPNAAAVSDALDRCDVEPLFAWIQHIRETQPEIINAFEQYIKGKSGSSTVTFEELIVNSFGRQKARYDGDLQGTQVGMILFYTDLTAKLWDFDYKRSTPREIDDFKSKVEIATKKVSPLFRKQTEQTPWARLWFGPDSRGYQAVDDSSLVFARKATRLFAKSKSTSLSQDEVEPNPPTAMFIDWWDDHFEEVARYEPQYERLNEIMKWSLLISWLNKHGEGDRLAFLNNRAMVKRDYRFPEWARQQSDLRFNKWSDDMFVPAGGKCVDTEAMPLLTSSNFTPLGETRSDWSLIGGVSLAEESIFAERTALSAEAKVAPLARRSVLNYSPIKSAESVVETIEGSAFKLDQLAPNQVKFTSIPKFEAALRTDVGDLASGQFQHVLTSEPRLLNVVAKYGETNIGDLSISRIGNGFKIGWESRELDVAQSIAQKMSSSSAPEQVLAHNPMVESAIKLTGEEGYLFRVTGSEKWTRLRVDANASADLEAGWQARFADLAPNSKTANIKFLYQRDVNVEIVDGQYFVMNGRQAGSGGSVIKTAEVPAATGERITIVQGEQKIIAVVDRSSESVYIKYGDLPESFQQNPGRLQKAISELDLKQIPGDGVLRISEGNGLGQSRLSQEFLAGKYEDLTKQLAQSPAEFKAALEQDLSNALKRSDDLLASRNYEKLENQLDELSEIYGPRPELNIRKGIAQIQRGEINSAAQSFNESILNQGGQGRNLFFDEINLRLQNTASPQQPLVQVAYDNKIFSINCKVKNLPDAVSVRPENIDLDSAIFYVEKNPRLNNLDWNTNVQASLNQAIEGEFGEVVRLPSGGLDNYRPTRIYAEDTGQVFESIQQKTTPSNFRLPVIVGRNPRCDEEREDQKHCGDIYIIRTRPGN